MATNANKRIGNNLSAPTISVCIAIEHGAAGLLRVTLGDLCQKLNSAGGELIMAGDVREVAAPSGVTLIPAPEDAQARRRGRLRNVSIAPARGKLIISADASALFGPPEWPQRLIEWARLIDERVPFIFGFQIVSPQGGRLWDWIRVSHENRITPVDYGEQVSGLAVGAGHVGISRAAWDLLGGFHEANVGPGEEIEFTLRASREEKIPLVYCDALEAVRVIEPKSVKTAPTS